MLAQLAPQLRAMDNEIHAISDRSEQHFYQLQAAARPSHRGWPKAAGAHETDLQDVHQHLASHLIAALGRSDLPAGAAVFASRLGVAMNTGRGYR